LRLRFSLDNNCGLSTFAVTKTKEKPSSGSGCELKCISASNLNVYQSADAIVLADPQSFMQQFKDKLVICFSGTIHDGKTSGLETKVLNMMGLEILDFWPHGLAK
jgi:hypothetical protein